MPPLKKRSIHVDLVGMNDLSSAQLANAIDALVRSASAGRYAITTNIDTKALQSAAFGDPTVWSHPRANARPAPGAAAKKAPAKAAPAKKVVAKKAATAPVASTARAVAKAGAPRVTPAKAATVPPAPAKRRGRPPKS